jgi:hypothetical protein
MGYRALGGIGLLVLLAGSAGAAPRPNLYVLAIGINDFQSRGLKLSCAAGDAREIEKAFRAGSKDLFEVKTRLLIDGDATRRGILAGFAWLADNMKAACTCTTWSSTSWSACRS